MVEVVVIVMAAAVVAVAMPMKLKTIITLRQLYTLRGVSFSAGL